MRNKNQKITTLPEDLKVTVLDTRYIVDREKRTVVALMDWRVSYSRFSRLQDLVLTTRTWDSPLVKARLTSRGIAKAKAEDQFDGRKGKRIALARAEMAAYDAVRKELGKVMKTLDFICGEIEMFNERTERIHSSNREFIRKVDSGEL